MQKLRFTEVKLKIPTKPLYTTKKNNKSHRPLSKVLQRKTGVASRTLWAFSQRVNLSCHPLSALILPSGLVDDTRFLLMQTTITSSIATAFIISRKIIVSFRSSEFNQKSHSNGNVIIE